MPCVAYECTLEYGLSFVCVERETRMDTLRDCYSTVLSSGMWRSAASRSLWKNRGRFPKGLEMFLFITPSLVLGGVSTGVKQQHSPQTSVKVKIGRAIPPPPSLCGVVNGLYLTVAQWLSYYAISQKVAGSRPGEAIIFIDLYNPFRSTTPCSLLSH
jgi:hypothetical protein